MDLADHLATLAVLLLVAAGLVYLVVERAGRRFRRPQDLPVPAGLDRRRHQRHTVARVVAVLPHTPAGEGVPVRNVSSGGMCLSVGHHPLPTDAVFRATILAPGRAEPLTAEARTIWSDGDQAGLAFVHVDPSLRRWIDSM